VGIFQAIITRLAPTFSVQLDA